MSLPVSVDGEILADYARLPSEALRDEAIAYVLRLANEPYLGLKLRDHPSIGDLSDCRKIYFGGAAFRIVYRLRPDEVNPKDIKVIVLGRRALDWVYLEAVKRLGRHT